MYPLHQSHLHLGEGGEEFEEVIVDLKGRSRRASQASQAVAGLPQIAHHRSHSRGPPQAARSATLFNSSLPFSLPCCTEATRVHYGGSPTDRGRSPSAGAVTGAVKLLNFSQVTDLLCSFLYLGRIVFHLLLSIPFSLPNPKCPLQAGRTGRPST